jgi:ubiquinone/menaquinone biosynthesis C-methylase UbiE
MPVVRVDNYLDAYRLRAQADDPHEMAARGDRKNLTEFVNRQILDAIQVVPEDVLVDIGCGDGRLLNLAAGRIAKGIGITASEDEQRKLQSTFPQFSFVAARAQALPLPSAMASKIVCNALLFYLPSEEDVASTLREIARIARPDATIWIGEVSEIDEYTHYRMYRGTSMPAFLWHLLTHNGLRAFLGMIKRWAKATFGKEQIVLNSAGFFYAKPEKLISMAESAGLRLRTYFRHKDLNDAGKIRECDFRYDYIFTV